MTHGLNLNLLVQFYFGLVFLVSLQSVLTLISIQFLTYRTHFSFFYFPFRQDNICNYEELTKYSTKETNLPQSLLHCLGSGQQ